MFHIEEEKLNMKKLAEIRPNLNIDITDHKIEKMISELDIIDENVQGEEVASMFDTDHMLRREFAIFNENVKRNVIIIDSREFKSTLPIHLYQQGFWLMPMQITIGDYILSDEVCIERKSVSTGDLFESFKSGRLLQ